MLKLAFALFLMTLPTLACAGPDPACFTVRIYGPTVFASDIVEVLFVPDDGAAAGFGFREVMVCTIENLPRQILVRSYRRLRPGKGHVPTFPHHMAHLGVMHAHKAYPIQVSRSRAFES